jgi:nucleoid DNA-binding protein
MIVSKEEFIKLVVDQFAEKLSAADAELVVNGVIKAFIEGMKKGKVRIFRFGSFNAVIKPARRGHNPRTGEVINIPDKVVIKFIPSPNLKEIFEHILLKESKTKVKESKTKVKESVEKVAVKESKTKVKEKIKKVAKKK